MSAVGASPARTFQNALARGDTMVAVDLSTKATADSSPGRYSRGPRSPAARRRYSVLLTKVAALDENWTTDVTDKDVSRALADPARIEYLC